MDGVGTHMTVELKEFIKEIINEQEKANLERIRGLERDLARLEQLVASKMEAQQLAIQKAEVSIRERFAGVNEFRAALSDLTREYVTRAVIEAKFMAQTEKIAGIDARLTTVLSRLANLDGRIIGYSAGIGMVVLIISIVSQLLNLGG